MKFTCSTADLLTALQLCSRAIGGQQALPILGNIHLQAEGKRCTLSATDLEFSIVTSIPADIENEGAITVPAKAIVNVAQNTTDAELLLETTEDTQIKVKGGHTKTVLSGESASDYPQIPSIEKKSSFIISAAPLLSALNLVTFASARTGLRPVLSGVSVRSEKNTFILVATDSYRLSEYIVPAPGAAEDIACIIPVKVLDELKSILAAAKPLPQAKESKGKGKEKEEMDQEYPGVSVTLSPQQIELTVGATKILSRLIDGKFPDYKQIIPASVKSTAAVSIKELLTAVRRMHYFAKEANNNLTFTIGGGTVKITTPQTAVGRDEAVLQCEGEGEGKIALSSSYLLDFLGHATGDTVELGILDSMHPAMFKLPADTQLLHLIMPLRMQEE